MRLIDLADYEFKQKVTKIIITLIGLTGFITLIVCIVLTYLNNTKPEAISIEAEAEAEDFRVGLIGNNPVELDRDISYVEEDIEIPQSIINAYQNLDENDVVKSDNLLIWNINKFDDITRERIINSLSKQYKDTEAMILFYESQPNSYLFVNVTDKSDIVMNRKNYECSITPRKD